MAAPAGVLPHRRPSAHQVGVSLVVLVAVYAFLLPRVASYEAAWHELRRADHVEWVLLAAAWNLVSYWFLLVTALPGLTLRQAALSSQVTTAVSNSVPGGGLWGIGLTYSMYREWGFDAGASSRAVLVTGIWNDLVKVATPLLAVVVLVTAGGEHDRPVKVAIVSTVVFLGAIGALVGFFRNPGHVRRVALLAEQATGTCARLVRRAPPSGWPEAAEQARQDAADLVARRWPALTAAALTSHASLFLVLLAALRAVGVDSREVSWPEVLAAFAVVRAAVMLPVTPGGAGLTELGLTGLLLAAGGTDERVVAGVLLFRALTWLLPIALGPVAYVGWLRGRRSR